MAVELVFRPLDKPLPAPPDGHRRAQFRSGYDDTLKLLREEAGRIGASRVVVQVDVSERRAVARYGIGESGEQYRGWAALPVGQGTGLSDEDAAKWLATTSAHPRYEGDNWRRLLDEPGTLEHARTEAVKRTHPDRGGDPAQFVLLGKVVDQLRARHGRTT